MPSTRIVTTGLRITIVETTATVIVSPVEHGVNALSGIACRGTGGFVVAIARTRRDIDAVRLCIVQVDGCCCRNGEAREIWYNRSVSQSTKISLRAYARTCRDHRLHHQRVPV